MASRKPKTRKPKTNPATLSFLRHMKITGRLKVGQIVFFRIEKKTEWVIVRMRVAALDWELGKVMITSAFELETHVVSLCKILCKDGTKMFSSEEIEFILD